jgi:L-lysine 6-transaminase
MDEEQTLTNVRWTGVEFLNRLKELSHNRGFFNVRGRGFMLAFDYQDGETRDKAYDKLSKHMLLLKSGPNSLRFRPPLNFSPRDVDRAMEILESVKV